MDGPGGLEVKRQMFSSSKKGDKELLLSCPHTFSCFLKLEKDIRGRCGILAGSLKHGHANINWECHENGKPRLWWSRGEWRDNYGAMGTKVDWKVNADLRTGTWKHLAFVVNEEGSEAKCYIDGKFVESHRAKFDLFVPTAETIIGADHRGETHLDFKGQLKDVKIYSNEMPALDIKKEFEANAPSPSDPKDTSEFNKVMNNSVFKLGAVEFGAVPVFLYFGRKRMTGIGQTLIYIMYGFIFCVTWWTAKRLSNIDDRSKAAYHRMWVTRVHMCKVNTHVSVFVKDFLSGIPQYTDNMALSLAIGDVAAKWDDKLQVWWHSTWIHVPLIGPILAQFTLAGILVVLMCISLATHIKSWLFALVSKDNITSARVAGLLALGSMDEFYKEHINEETKEEEFPEKQPYLVDKLMCVRAVNCINQSLSALRAFMGACVAMLRACVAKLRGCIIRKPEPLSQKLLSEDEARSQAVEDDEDEVMKMLRDGEEAVEDDVVRVATPPPASSVPTPGDPESEEGRLPTKEEQEAALLKLRFSACESRFIAKVVVGCSLRFWFKASYVILMVVTGQLDTARVMVFALANSLMHVAVGTQPYLTAALELLKAEAKAEVAAERLDTENDVNELYIEENKASDAEVKRIVRIRFLLKFGFRIVILLFPVWGSLVRLIGVVVCPSGYFAFTEFGCVSKSALVTPKLL